MHSSPKYWFFIILILIQLGIAWLVLSLLKKLFPYYRNKNVVYTYWLVTGAALLVTTLGRFSPSADLAAELMRLAFVWLIGQLAALIILPFFYGVARFVKARQPRPDDCDKNDDNNITRRDFLRGLVAAAPVSILGVTVYGVYSGGSNIVLQRHKLNLPQLPVYLNGFKIAQLSDTHIGFYFSLEKLEACLRTIMAEKPDMLVITGDLIDEVALAEQAMQKFAEIADQIPYGIYFCWGNHEYFRDINKVRQALNNSPVTLLENTAVRIAKGDKPFYLAGVDYPWARNADSQIAERGQMIGKALATVPDNAFTVLLSHHPDFITNAFEAGIPLTLTGHTHGGQIALFGRSLLPVQYRYMRGMYHQGDMHGYVHTGTGNWLPFRLGCPAEIAVFTLQG
ncbi:3',5'-cyclic adenosine monophosphate phosphodiesterase CpdA [bioreactor metagenome]|uniref:3',5'-cyclic adenosine monophosphate phosphodiesterase CpdA n=1 Tax=bioreactor metagenome TaxID=1076179 RepID=A0A644T9B8_9ZZZZ|nr:metallophosphoesterase [Negativicutes bacterium]